MKRKHISYIDNFTYVHIILYTLYYNSFRNSCQEWFLYVFTMSVFYLYSYFVNQD